MNTLARQRVVSNGSDWSKRQQTAYPWWRVWLTRVPPSALYRERWRKRYIQCPRDPVSQVYFPFHVYVSIMCHTATGDVFSFRGVRFITVQSVHYTEGSYPLHHIVIVEILLYITHYTLAFSTSFCSRLLLCILLRDAAAVEGPHLHLGHATRGIRSRSSGFIRGRFSLFSSAHHDRGTRVRHKAHSIGQAFRRPGVVFHPVLIVVRVGELTPPPWTRRSVCSGPYGSCWRYLFPPPRAKRYDGIGKKNWWNMALPCFGHPPTYGELYRGEQAPFFVVSRRKRATGLLCYSFDRMCVSY